MNDDIPRSEKTEVPDSLSGTGTDVRTEPAGSGLPADPEMPPENGPAYMDEDTLMMPDEDYNMYDPAVGMKLDEVLVITSYSIHYTKLYEDTFCICYLRPFEPVPDRTRYTRPEKPFQ